MKNVLLICNQPQSGLNIERVDDIDTICEHFCESVKPDTLKREWMTLKHTLVQDFTSPTEVMQTLASDETLSLLYPTFSKLSAVALVLPVSTADLVWVWPQKYFRRAIVLTPFSSFIREETLEPNGEAKEAGSRYFCRLHLRHWI